MKRRELAVLAVIALRLAGYGISATEPPPTSAKIESPANDGLEKPNVGKFDWPQWGGSSMRNNTPHDTNIPPEWRIASENPPVPGKNIKWSARLGSSTFSSPVVANGKVFIGTNNGAGYLARFPSTLDMGCVLCFEENSGRFLWQHSNRKLPSRMHDQPAHGVASVPLVDGDRLWYVSNRGEVVCLDTEGFYDGQNDGPFQDEEVAGGAEADVVWKFDILAKLGAPQYRSCDCSLTCAGDILFVATSNGFDFAVHRVPAPEAPAFFALNRKTAEVLWTDNSPGPNILRRQWSSPTYAVLGGRPQVLFGGGDGWLYSFDARGDGAGKSRLLWKFDCNAEVEPTAPGKIAIGRCSRTTVPVVYDQKIYIAVGEDPEFGLSPGQLWCIDPAKKLDGADVSPLLQDGRPNPDSAMLWNYREFDLNGNGRIEHEECLHRSMGSVAIKDDLLYIIDMDGFAHCVNAQSGKPHWTHDLLAASLGPSPLIVDGKVYIADEDGDILILSHSAKKEVIGEINMGGTIFSTPIVANGVLYVATSSTLFAIADDSKTEAKRHDGAESKVQQGSR